MVAVWSPEAKIVAERRLWLAVLLAQRELGVDVPESDYSHLASLDKCIAYLAPRLKK